MKDNRLVARLIDQVLDGSVYQTSSALDSIRYERRAKFDKSSLMSYRALSKAILVAKMECRECV